jgi:hypothetical protein
LNFVLLVAGGLLETLPLLVVDLAVPIARHDRALLAKVRVLQFIIVVGGLCVIGGRNVAIGTALAVPTQTEVLEVVRLLPVLRRRQFLVLWRVISTRAVVGTSVVGGLWPTVHGILGGLVGSIPSEEVASLGVYLVVHRGGTTLAYRVMRLRLSWVHTIGHLRVLRG